MRNATIVPTKELPPFVRDTLKRLGYHKHDIGIEPAETISPIDYGGAGQRGKVVIIDMASWTVVNELTGSWGGANMFSPVNQVDNDCSDYPIPVNAMVIKGSFGYCNYATLYVNPANAVQLLPPPEDEELTETEKSVLGVYRGIKSSYRPEYLNRIDGYNREIVTSLAERGYLKINKAGAVSVTVKGKNAPSNRVY